MAESQMTEGAVQFNETKDLAEMMSRYLSLKKDFREVRKIENSLISFSKIFQFPERNFKLAPRSPKENLRIEEASTGYNQIGR